MSNGAAAPTERLYYGDSYLATFTARVVDRADDGKRVYLDRTAFYPTSGGQLNDLGTLQGIAVVDVVDEDARIAHLLAAPLTAEVVATGAIDWRRRFDHMQQHTGQHLVSAVFEDLLGARTVSVHFGDSHSTLDLELDSLSSETLAKVQRRANELVAECRPVTVTYEDAGSAAGLRKAVDRQGTLRIVNIAELDRSACGGTHVRSTGEIGGVLLRATERIRKTMRVEFICGLRAVARARADYESLATIASSLSASIDTAAGVVAGQATQLKESEQARRRLERLAASYQAKGLYDLATPGESGIRFVLVKATTDEMESMRMLAQAMTELPKAAFAAHVDKGTQFIVATSADSGADAGQLVRRALDAVGGKGGGSPRIAQGNAPSAPDALTAVMAIHAEIARGR